MITGKKYEQKHVSLEEDVASVASSTDGNNNNNNHLLIANDEDGEHRPYSGAEEDDDEILLPELLKERRSFPAAANRCKSAFGNKKSRSAVVTPTPQRKAEILSPRNNNNNHQDAIRKVRPKSAAAPTNNNEDNAEITATVPFFSNADKESAIRRAYMSPAGPDSRHGEQVVARCAEDGFYYKGIIISQPESQKVIVEFEAAPVKRQFVTNDHALPISGAIARPTLRQNDYVLVQTKNYSSGFVCFVPGIVVTVPTCEANQPKFYGVLLYNHRSIVALRYQLLRISEHKYQATVSYINEQSRVNGVRMITQPSKPRPFSAGPNFFTNKNARYQTAAAMARLDRRIEKMIAESPFNSNNGETSSSRCASRNGTTSTSINLLGEILAREKRIDLLTAASDVKPNEKECTFKPETNPPERIASPYLEPSSASPNRHQNINNTPRRSMPEFRLVNRQRVKSAVLSKISRRFSPEKRTPRSKSPRSSGRASGVIMPADKLRMSFANTGKPSASSSDPNYTTVALKELKDGNLSLIKAGLRHGATTMKITEQLGDTLNELQHPELAVAVYVKTGSRGKIDKILQKEATNTDRWQLFKTVLELESGRVLLLAHALVEDGVYHDDIVDVYLDANRREECVDFLVVSLTGDNTAQKALQTRLFEIAFSVSKERAESLFAMKRYTKYDRHKICQLCQEAGMFERAVENSDSPEEIRRLLWQHAGEMKLAWLKKYFSDLDDFEQIVDILRDMLQSTGEHASRNRKIVLWLLEIFYPQWDFSRLLVELLNYYTGDDGNNGSGDNVIDLYRRLENLRRLNKNDVGLNTFYVETACFAGHVMEAELLCKDRAFHYDGRAVCNFLMQAKRPSLYRLLMFVCDRFGFVDQLVRFLYDNDQRHLVEAYVAVLNPAKLPDVVGVLRKIANEQNRPALIEGEITHLTSLVPVGQYNNTNK